MVSVITVNFNQPALTCALLDSIRAQDYREIEVVVVDNASTNDPTGWMAQQYPEVTFIRSDSNLGFAGGNNLALPGTTGDYLFFINNDAEIVPGCIEKLVSFFTTHPEAGAVSPLICYAPETDTPTPPVVQYAGMPQVNPVTSRSNMDGNGTLDRGQYTTAFHTGYAHGAAMMVPRKVVETVGRMDERYFLYYEEIDWCERIQQAGFGIWVEPQARVWHKESMTMRTLGATKTFYLTRNRIWFMRRHYRKHFWAFAIFMTFVTLPAHTFRLLRTRNLSDVKALIRGYFSGFFDK
jgi:GT2 family glycosyltransferase